MDFVSEPTLALPRRGADEMIVNGETGCRIAAEFCFVPPYHSVIEERWSPVGRDRASGMMGPDLFMTVVVGIRGQQDVEKFLDWGSPPTGMQERSEPGRSVPQGCHATAWSRHEMVVVVPPACRTAVQGSAGLPTGQRVERRLQMHLASPTSLAHVAVTSDIMKESFSATC
jgi:hypothetical protein